MEIHAGGVPPEGGLLRARRQQSSGWRSWLVRAARSVLFSEIRSRPPVSGTDASGPAGGITMEGAVWSGAPAPQPLKTRWDTWGPIGHHVVRDFALDQLAVRVDAGAGGPAGVDHRDGLAAAPDAVALQVQPRTPPGSSRTTRDGTGWTRTRRARWSRRRCSGWTRSGCQPSRSLASATDPTATGSPSWSTRRSLELSTWCSPGWVRANRVAREQTARRCDPVETILLPARDSMAYSIGNFHIRRSRAVQEGSSWSRKRGSPG
jgi:hypothetical protein